MITGRSMSCRRARTPRPAGAHDATPLAGAGGRVPAARENNKLYFPYKAPFTLSVNTRPFGARVYTPAAVVSVTPHASAHAHAPRTAAPVSGRTTDQSATSIKASDTGSLRRYQFSPRQRHDRRRVGRLKSISERRAPKTGGEVCKFSVSVAPIAVKALTPRPAARCFAHDFNSRPSPHPPREYRRIDNQLKRCTRTAMAFGIPGILRSFMNRTSRTHKCNHFEAGATSLYVGRGMTRKGGFEYRRGNSPGLRLGVTLKSVTLGNVTMSHRTREVCRMPLSLHSTMIGLPRAALENYA
ncbi:hypothetical protein EVAR_28651_1 [Eumeta japonica]|uniref:Uncharacterized protein n=1 Tax=Eumeta variegata TaxID=151549 RepID=A0A4C2A9Y7_EUMVA|nr:hypothetical protein EVAR_28651_1 [Eumeta japonica]